MGGGINDIHLGPDFQGLSMHDWAQIFSKSISLGDLAQRPLF